MMQVNRFETVLPKGARFFAPFKPATQPPATRKPVLGVLGYLLVGAALGAALMALPKQAAPVTAAPTIAIAPTPPPLPASVPPRALPVPSQGSVPRAQLIHVREIGTVENDRMPDGRTLTTLYRGELSSPASLPTRGAQLGDMWYTRNDGNCWVLAPLSTGSQAIGWVDP